MPRYYGYLVMRLLSTTILIAFSVAGIIAMLWHLIPSKEMKIGAGVYDIGRGAPESVTADSWLIFDMETGEPIAEQSADAVVPIASVTKLMTAEIAFADMDLATTTMISYEAIATEGRAGRLVAGEHMTIRELVFPLLLESSNDASSALAEAYGHQAFIKRMNARARELGMQETAFADASGLSPENRSTAKDLGILLSHIFNARRHLLDITMLSQYVGVRHDWRNNDPVVGSVGYLGGKHGFTGEAGRTFAGVFEAHLRGGELRPIGIVLLSSDDITHDVERLRSFVEANVGYRYAF